MKSANTPRPLPPLALLLAPLAALALATGCPPIETDIPSSQDIDVPGQGILGGNPLAPAQAFPADLVGQALAQSIQSSFDTSGYDKSHVSSLVLDKLTLTVQSPEEGGQQVRDLSFLSKLTIFLGASGDDTGKIKVAESGDGDFDSKPVTYEMPLTKAELADVFKANDQLEMTSDVEPGPPPRFETTVTVDSNIHVAISVF